MKKPLRSSRSDHPVESMSIHIRPARKDDQATIRRIIWAARLAPLRLSWPTFLVAEEGDTMVGVGQVKTHGDGSRELASLAVVPAYQGRGIGSALVRAMLAREQGTLYLFCRKRLESYYARFGFRQIDRPDLPVSLSRLLALAELGDAVIQLFTNRRLHIIAMVRFKVPGNETK